jgi:hypothetical protein
MRKNPVSKTVAEFQDTCGGCGYVYDEGDLMHSTCDPKDAEAFRGRAPTIGVLALLVAAVVAGCGLRVTTIEPLPDGAWAAFRARQKADLLAETIANEPSFLADSTWGAPELRK